MQPQLNHNIFDFLKRLKANNTKDWMDAHRKEYRTNEKLLKAFFGAIKAQLGETDDIAALKVFRINRDIRFSADKTPYNAHRSVRFIRAGAHRRGGYYLRLEPGNSMMAAGFFKPEPKDLYRIRKEFEMDSKPIRALLEQKDFREVFGGFNQEFRVKTSPKGFDRNHPHIDLIRLKSFFVSHRYEDNEVFSPDFLAKLIQHYELSRPFLDYMSDVLTTDLNGVSLLEDDGD